LLAGIVMQRFICDGSFGSLRDMMCARIFSASRSS
jgi:hypothetical protein